MQTKCTTDRVQQNKPTSRKKKLLDIVKCSNGKLKYYTCMQAGSKEAKSLLAGPAGKDFSCS